MADKIVCTGYENKGICAMCGGTLPSRRREYCSGACYDLYLHLFFWPQAQFDAMQSANHKCQCCGITDRGYSRLYQWRLHKSFYATVAFEVHHIIALNGESRTWHVLNIESNLAVLCHDCHLITRSRKLRETIRTERLQLKLSI